MECVAIVSIRLLCLSMKKNNMNVIHISRMIITLMHVSVFFIMFTVIFAGGQAAHSSLKKSRQPRGLTNIENMSRTFGSPCCNCFCVFLRKTLDSHSITVLFSIKVCKWAQTPCINKDWLSTDTFLNTPTGSHKFS